MARIPLAAMALLGAASALGAGGAHAQGQPGALELDPVPEWMKTFRSAEFSGTLTTAGGHGISGATVTIIGESDSGARKVMGTGYTDSTGEFKARWTPRPDDSGKWRIYAVYEGGQKGTGRTESWVHESVVAARDSDLPQNEPEEAAGAARGPSLLLGGIPKRIGPGEEVGFAGRLVQPDGRPLGGKPVYVMADKPGQDRILAHATTDFEGRFVARWRGDAGIDRSHLVVYALFAGDAANALTRSGPQQTTVLGGVAPPGTPGGPPPGGGMTIGADPESYTVREGVVKTVQISGATDSPNVRDVMVQITEPDGTNHFTSAPAAGGKFSTFYRMSPDSDVGTYLVSGASGDRRAEASFEVLGPGGAAPAGGPPAVRIEVSADKGVYGVADVVVVATSGTAGQDIELEVRDPDGGVVATHSSTLSADGRHAATMDIGDVLDSRHGTYVITASYAGAAGGRAGGVDTTSFVVAAPAPPAPPAQQAPPRQPSPSQAQAGPQQASAQQAPARQAPAQPSQAQAAPQDQADLLRALLVAGGAAAIVAAIVLLRKRSGAGKAAQAAAPASGASIMSFYECPRCHSPDIDNKPDGGAECRSCGFVH